MAFVHGQSCEGVKSELDLFAVPPTQTSIEHGGWIEHQPITSLDSGGPIEFVVPGAGDAYIDLANTYLLVRAKVVRGVGTDIADDTPVAPVNNWLHSLFSQVDVHLNDTLVTPSSNTYPFRAYVETLLSYGAEAKKTQLTSQLWYKDTAGHMEATQENGGNAGSGGATAAHSGESSRRDDGEAAHRPFHAGPVPNQRCHCQDTTRAQQGRLLADGRRREPRLQGAHSGRCPVRAQGRVESDGGDGAHTGVGEGNGEVSAPPGRLQGILDSTRLHVEHAREPVPRNAAETHHPVVRRQRRAQRRIRKKPISREEQRH